MRGAQWKGEQLLRAQRMGFRVPASLVTNSPEQVRSFKAGIPGDLIFKSMSSPMLGADLVADGERISAGIGTTIITDDMMDSLDAVSELACHFQEYIPKKYELRVTIIGARIFTAKIDSQADSRTAIDSRDMSAPIKYAPYYLPDDLQRRCLLRDGGDGRQRCRCARAGLKLQAAQRCRCAQGVGHGFEDHTVLVGLGEDG